MANDMHTDTAQTDVLADASELLKQKNAPKGDVASDFKTAVYLCAATRHFSFEEVLSNRRLDLLSFMLSSVGFKGSTSNISIEQYLDVIQELIDDGALQYIGHSAGFVATGFARVCEGEVSCVNVRREPPLSAVELRFDDGEGNTYPLFSKFMIIPGDRVKVVVNTFINAAYVIKLVKMRSSLIGDVTGGNKKIFFREKGFSAYDIRVTKDEKDIKGGSLVVAEILARKAPNILVVRPTPVKGDRGMLDNFIIKALLEHGIPSAWPETVKSSIKSIPAVVKKDEIKGRVDLRDLPLVTIDGEDAKDFDDAVYCEMQGSKFHLYVAIADVSYYVRTGSAIDAEALERTTSVYFPYYVVPMLPEELSNGICSLNPGVDRLCMVCEMIVNTRGRIESYEFYPAVMNSHARLTYTEAWSMISEGKAISEENQKCVPWVKTLHKLYQALRKAREGRGAFEFESTEVNFLFDEKWRIKGMVPYERNDAHMLIEECMIAANVCAASFVKENGFQSLYRVHSRPTEEKLDRLRAILSKHGIDLAHGYEPTPLDFKDVSLQVSKLAEGVHQIISLQLLRSMSKATYSPDNIGHFGLALENYSHFTSPIRRYPDLQIHRVIKYILEKKQKREWGKIGSQQYSHDALVKLGNSCTEKEISAADAEYDVDNSLKCEYVRNFIGEAVDATVSTISSHGIFVTLNDFYIDGMLKDGCTINANDRSFVCYGGAVFHEGDQIKVRIGNVNSQARFIDLMPVESPRKSDAKFDINAAKEQLKSTASEGYRGSNDVKNAFLDDIGRFTRGVEPDNSNTVTRPHCDFSVAKSLNISEDESISNIENAKNSSRSAKGSKAAARTKPAQQATSEPADAQESKAAKGKSKAAAKAAPAKAEAAKDKAQDESVSSGTVITVKRKTGSSTARTKVIALDDSEKAQEKPARSRARKNDDDVDPLLIDTASRIDADLESAGQSRPSKKSGKSKAEKADKADSASPAKSGRSTASRSNAKSRQAEETVSEQEVALGGDTTVTVTRRSRAKAQTQADSMELVRADEVQLSPPSEPEAKPAAKKTAASKAASAKTPAKQAARSDAAAAEAEPEARPAAKKARSPAKPAAKAAAEAAEAEPEAKPAAKKTAAAKAPARTAAKPVAKTKAADTKAEPEGKPAAKKTAAAKAPAKSDAKPAAKSAAAAAAEAEPEAKPAAKKTAAAKAPARTAAKPVAKTKAADAEAEPEAKPAAKKTAATKAAATKAQASSTAKAKAAAAEAEPETKQAAKKSAATKAAAAKAPARSAARTKAADAEAEPEAKPAAKKTAAAKAPARSAAKPAAKTKSAAAEPEAKPAAKKPAAKKTAASAASAESQPLKKPAIRKSAKKTGASDK